MTMFFWKSALYSTIVKAMSSPLTWIPYSVFHYLELYHRPPELTDVATSYTRISRQTYDSHTLLVYPFTFQLYMKIYHRVSNRIFTLNVSNSDNNLKLNQCLTAPEGARPVN